MPHPRSSPCSRAALAAAALVALLVAAETHAQSPAQSPAVRHALTVGQGPVWLPRQPPSGSAELLVRFVGDVPVEALRSLENRGLTLVRVGGSPLVWRHWALVRVDARGVALLATLQGVRDVYVPPPPGLPPLDRSAALLGLDAARGAARVREPWTGRGVVIADIDSHVDVFHPDFFLADGGWYDWIDVDGDGVFSPGVDVVDLDGDGSADPEERTGVLRAAPVDLAGASTASLTRSGFDPAVDWLYVDADGDGQRNFGAAAGYSDAAPALGEPLFVPDDVDGDGRLGLAERLVRLGTSKLRAVMVRVDWPGFPAHDAVYTRGESLSRSPNDVTGGVYGYADTLHATGVLGILAGGVPLPSRRWVGIAPEAELVNAFELASSDAGRMLWSLSQEADVLLHEYVTWTRVALDGSDAFSVIIDEATASGVASVCPAGNIGGSMRHVERALESGEEAVFPLRVPPGVTQLEIALHARGPGLLVAELVVPDGAYPFTTDLADHRVGESLLYTYGETTARGTDMQFALLYGSRVEASSVRVRAVGGSLVVHGMTADDYGFATGAAWDGATAASTIAAPATADSCLAIGSTPAHEQSEGSWYSAGPEARGDVRGYSARGPRIDGLLRPHVLAPDNPWSALGYGDVLPSRPDYLVAPHGGYMVFGGTSGAGPHAAGVVGLLVETGLDGPAALDRVRATAVADARTGVVPNDDFGHGRLSAVAALGGDASGSPPRVSLRAEPPTARPGQPVRLVVEVSDSDGGALEVRWDDDYDGTWDTEYAAPSERTVAFPAAGRYRWKVRARDATGLVADAAAVLVVTEDAVEPDAGPQVADAGVDGGVSAGASGGCGCGALGGRPSPAGVALMVAALLALGRRRLG